MSALRKVLTTGLATLTLAGLAMVTFSTDAEAQRRWRGRGGGFNPGAAAAAGIVGGLALGAIAAGAAQPRPPIVDDCYTVRRRVWDDYNGVWRVRRVRVCD